MYSDEIAKTTPLAAILALFSIYIGHVEVIAAIVTFTIVLKVSNPIWIVGQYLLFLISDPTLVLQIGMLTAPMFYYRKLGKTWKEIDNIIKPMGDLKSEFMYAVKMTILLELTMGALLHGLGVFGLNDATMSVEITPLFVLTTLIAPISEEIFFRGLLFNMLGLWESSIIFGLMHVGSRSIATILAAIVGGVFLGKAYEIRKTLLAPILIHFIVNFLSLIAATQILT